MHKQAKQKVMSDQGSNENLTSNKEELNAVCSSYSTWTSEGYADLILTKHLPLKQRK